MLTLNTNTNNNTNNANAIKCRFCGSNHWVKHSKTYNNKDRYLCKECFKNFSLNDKRVKHNLRHIELALLLYSHNSSLRSIQSVLELFFNIKLSFNVLDRWIKNLSNRLEYYDNSNSNNINNNSNNNDNSNNKTTTYSY
jgi:transposase-like protein